MEETIKIILRCIASGVVGSIIVLTVTKIFKRKDDYVRIKIKIKDCRKKTLATKAKRSSNVLTISDNLNKAEDK
jgi:uncharacterized membrane-anchored protein YitT (DUF2179 family)